MCHKVPLLLGSFGHGPQSPAESATLLRQLRYLRATGIGEREHARDLVEGLANGIVARLPDEFVCEPLAHGDKLGMTTRDEEGKHRQFYVFDFYCFARAAFARASASQACKDMSLHMVY